MNFLKNKFNEKFSQKKLKYLKIKDFKKKFRQERYNALCLPE